MRHRARTPRVTRTVLIPVSVGETEDGFPEAVRYGDVWMPVVHVQVIGETPGRVLQKDQVVKTSFAATVSNGETLTLLNNHLTGGWYLLEQSSHPGA